MSNRRDEEPSGAAGGIEHALVWLGIEHLHHQLDGATRGEILTTVTAQVRPDDLLIGSALRVDIGATEVVLRELGHHERERPV